MTPETGADREKRGEATNRNADLLTRGLSLGYGAALVLSRPLWLTERSYPHLPALSFLPQPPPPIDRILFAAVLVALLAAAATRFRRLPISGALAVTGAWALLDQSRWQPYAIHFTVLLGCCLAAHGASSRREIARALRPALLLLAATYIYAGAHKLNADFTDQILPRLLQPIAGPEEGAWPWWLRTSLTVGIGLAEAGAGFCLLAAGRIRRLGARGLLLMHGAVLLAIGPLGLDMNPVVWPWNAALILVLVEFFLRDGLFNEAPAVLSASWRREVWGELVGGGSGRRSAILTLGVLILFGAMPLLSFLDRWDAYPSFSLYSGNIATFTLSVAPDDLARIPDAARRVARRDGKLSLSAWSHAETGAVAYPEERIARNAAAALASRAVSGPVYLEIAPRRMGRSERPPPRVLRYPPGGGEPVRAAVEEYRFSR